MNIKRDSKEKELKILIPAGVTRLGFSDGETITSGGQRWGQTISAEGIEFEIFFSVLTDSLSSDIGFSLDMLKDVITTLEKDKTGASVSAEGSLKLKVPWGFTGFPLTGMSGSVIEGMITIERNQGEKKKFNIYYGNMKVKK